MNNIFIAIVILGILSLKVFAQVNTCGNNEKFGDDNPNDDSATGEVGMYYRTCAGDYKIPCCGVISQWTYHSATNGIVSLQIWRLVSGNTYRLINSYNHNAAAADTQYTATPGRVLVKENDCLGWYSNGIAAVVGYKNGGGKSQTAVILPEASVDTSGDVDWSSATNSAAGGDGDNEWSIGGTLTTAADPTFSGPATGTITNAASVSDTVETVTFADTDIDDEITLTMATNTYFDFTDNGDLTGTITVKASLIPAGGTTETLSITATDLCEGTITQSVTITITNDPPSLQGYAVTVQISEDVNVDTTITPYTCNDTSGSVNTSISEPSGNFYYKQTGNADEYALMARAPAAFSASNPITVTISCCDNVECVTSDTTVLFLANQAPNITNLPDGTSVNAAANETPGTILFNVTYDDNENDAVNCTYTCEPVPTGSTCPIAVTVSCNVVVTGSLEDAAATAYNIFVSVNDKRNTGIVRSLSVIVTGKNTPPTFSNLNNSVPVADGTASGQNIFTVTAVDTDGDSIVYQWSAPNGTLYFSINSSTGAVTTIQGIDFDTVLAAEGVSQFEFVVTASDGQDSATATLTVSILDTNNPFTFGSSVYRGTITEWANVSTTLTDIVFSMIDGDTSDTYTCSMDCGNYSGYFAMSSSCNVSVASLYKLDLLLPTEITCNVTATDSGGNVDTTSVVITIDYDNNYTPTFGSTSYDFVVSSAAVADTDIGYVNATDSDVGSFETFSYSLNLTAPESTYFKIDSSTGLIKTKSSISACNCVGTTFTLPVIANDTGGRAGSSVVQITVVETTTTVQDRYKTFFDDERNIWWFSLLMALLAVTAVVTAFVCFKYVCMKPCKNPFGRRRGWNLRHTDRETYRRPPSPKPRADTRPAQLHTIRKPPGGDHTWKSRNRLY